MADIEIKLVGDWKKMAFAVDPERFNKNLAAYVGKATTFNGMYVSGEMRKRIKNRRYMPNTPFTVLLKGSSTPLVDNNDLANSITYQAINTFSVFVGILRTAVGPGGRSMIDLAKMLHDGGIIPVTEKMRNMFALLYEVGQGTREASTLEGRAAELAAVLGDNIKSIRPLKQSTTQLFIPQRPFIEAVLRDPAVIRKIGSNWEKAVKAAFKDQASGRSGQGGAPGSSNTAAKAAARKMKPPKSPNPRKQRNRSEAARKGWKTRRAKQPGKSNS